MAGEKAWVQSLSTRLQLSLQICDAKEWQVKVCCGEKLTYAHEISMYQKDGHVKESHRAKYETDLLIYDSYDNGDWIPRVVLECKLGNVTTHDALTYSSKAATHKHVHPYLRYGILIGAFDSALPGRLIRHGAFFDFMLAWESGEPNEQKWAELTDLLAAETKASRELQSLLTDTRRRARKKVRLLRRPLIMTESSE